MNSLKVNKHIKTLCIADNKCGDQVLSLLAGRLTGNVTNVMNSVKCRKCHLSIDISVPSKQLLSR